ncbi:hypothetical protein C2E23DRAFT_29442 [Lenzites betulinus]|nr:hypothetical protein C2E23DRAFT_29442 [Lenzites betulinus]
MTLYCLATLLRLFFPFCHLLMVVLMSGCVWIASVPSPTPALPLPLRRPLSPPPPYAPLSVTRCVPAFLIRSCSFLLIVRYIGCSSPSGIYGPALLVYLPKYSLSLPDTCVRVCMADCGQRGMKY